jgi:hypothetical protein
MINVYGTIGFTFLKNKSNRYILVLADMHSALPYCKESSTKISDWLFSKLSKTNVLLEEVPRDESIKLQELWSDSEHTQDLKNLFLKNNKIIQAVDIRPYLIPFSWEMIKLTEPNIKLNEYIKLINDFFILNLINNKKIIINKQIYEQFTILKNTYLEFKNSINDHLHKNIKEIYDQKQYILVRISEILDHIMELYILNKIKKNLNKNIILHTGLAHSQEIIEWLDKLYNYDILEKQGTNTLNNITDLDVSHGCLRIPHYIDHIFN